MTPPALSILRHKVSTPTGDPAAIRYVAEPVTWMPADGLMPNGMTLLQNITQNQPGSGSTS
ncbi:hypothetical protein Apa02nite_063780 [Actinoplanes palleronii]|uniref:Uncharacterized protein n=1 Tax=Actinoplanes palleronii TaxID=113570 RepID=A0ABQ4BJ20_9ACTN|nr:hypothetical protein Apa02nite_063780 [Actinoplanes palleronii]